MGVEKNDTGCDATVSTSNTAAMQVDAAAGGGDGAGTATGVSLSVGAGSSVDVEKGSESTTAAAVSTSNPAAMEVDAFADGGKGAGTATGASLAVGVGSSMDVAKKGDDDEATAAAVSTSTVAAVEEKKGEVGSVITFNPVTFREDMLVGESLSVLEKGLLRDPQHRELARKALRKALGYAWKEAREKHTLSTAVCDPMKSVAQVLAAGGVKNGKNVLMRLAFERDVWTALDLENHLIDVADQDDGGFADLMDDEDRVNMVIVISQGAQGCPKTASNAELILLEVRARIQKTRR